MRPISLTNDAQARGLESEERVLEACRLEPRPAWLRRVRRATRTEDHSGIDVVVESDVGRLFVQVKSSPRGAARFRPRRFLRIGIVVVHPGDSPGLLLEKVVDTLRGIRAQYLKEMRSKGVVRVEPGDSPRRPRVVVPPLAPKPFKTKWKRPLEDPTPTPSPRQVGPSWPELRDCLLAAMLRAGPRRPSTDDELRIATEALAKRNVDLEAVVARYPAIFRRGEDGTLRTPVDLVSAYRLRLARCCNPAPRDVLRRVLELLASIAVAGDSVILAELPWRLARGSNGELTEDQVNGVLRLVRGAGGWERASGEPGSKIRAVLRPWLLEPAKALDQVEEGALAHGASESGHRVSVAPDSPEEERGPPRCLDRPLAACRGRTPRRVLPPLARTRGNRHSLREVQLARHPE